MEKEILYRFCCRQTSPEEERRILDWLNADPENQHTLDQMRCVVECMTFFAAEHPNGYARASDRKSIFRSVVFRITATAAMVTLMVGLYYVSTICERNRWVGQTAEVIVPSGQRLEMKLQDGTHVWLNAGAKLVYPVAFAGKIRRVWVAGEAMFHVTPDAEKPFVVETFASVIKVLGTKFNVIADSNNHYFSAALLEGHIEIIDYLTDARISLSPNEMVELKGDIMEKSQIKNPDIYRWTEGLLCLDGNMPFEALMHKFEQIYGVKIFIRCHQLPEIKPINGKIRVADGINHALEVLQFASDFKYEVQEDGVIVIR